LKGPLALLVSHLPTHKMTSPLFTPSALTELQTTHINVCKKIQADKLAAAVKATVARAAHLIRNNSNNIMDALKNDIVSAKTHPYAWAKVFEFISYDFGKLPMKGNSVYPYLPNMTYNEAAAFYNRNTNSEFETTSFSMWVIWRHTDFRTRLLEELQLDPAHFQFKNIAQPLECCARLFRREDELDIITEYLNEMYLVYRP